MVTSRVDMLTVPAPLQLERELGREIGCSAIHGDKDQRQRDMVLANFKAPQRHVLCATPFVHSRLCVSAAQQ